MKSRALWSISAILLCLWFLSACTSTTTADHYRESDFARVDKVDAHVHLHDRLPVFMGQVRKDGFRLLTINVNYPDFPPLAEQQRVALALGRQYPDRVAFAASFNAAGSATPGWLAATLGQLDDALAQGAVGVKVWKDIGMQLRDADGRAVMIDDERFTPVFQTLTKRGVVVLGHQGEPRNAWLPLDQMTIRGDRQYFSEHPQYHMYQHGEWPSYEQQIAARDRLLDRHPAMHFVGLHLASLEWDVARIADFLRRYPGASVDLAARLVHLQRQAVTDRDHVRAFFMEFQDRILYGSDLASGTDESDATFAGEAHAAWLSDWVFLTSARGMSSAEFAGRFHGLALPRTVIDKLYRENARRLFPAAWPDARRGCEAGNC